MQISLVTTVLNEESTIVSLLKAIESQSQPPDEVIIVDGGSTDSTVQKIRNFHEKSPLEVICLVKKSNRSRGRNLGIGQAIGEGIAVTDAGCLPDKHWFKNITKPLRDKKAEVVAGVYKVKTDSVFTRCSALFFAPMSHNIKPQTYLPASRSIAFTKSAWKQIGGYPESLDFAAEDLIFAQKLRADPSLKMVLRKSALVEWTPASNLPDFFHDIKNHTRGHIQAGYAPHLRQNALVAVRYALAFPLLVAAVISLNPVVIAFVFTLAFIYLLYPALKFRSQIKSPQDVFLLALLQVTADLAVLAALSRLAPVRK